MPIFTSKREKHLWLWAIVVSVAIYSTLFVGQPLARIFADQNIQAIIFLLGLLLIVTAIFVHGIMTSPTKTEVAILLGVTAVYTMLILRLGLPERSHLIEYSALAIVIYEALNERIRQGTLVPNPVLLAISITTLIGIIDESLQVFIPNRVFDINDMLFNTFAALMAISSSALLTWARKKIRNKSN